MIAVRMILSVPVQNHLNGRGFINQSYCRCCSWSFKSQRCNDPHFTAVTCERNYQYSPYEVVQGCVLLVDKASFRPLYIVREGMFIKLLGQVFNTA